MIRLVTFLMLVFISSFSIAQEIESGVIAMASNPIKITNAQGEVRIAKTGDKIYLNDKIQTDSQGKTQILLKDQMTISLGPNSQMVVDKFVYDPKEKSKNELSTQIKQGAFKFISGKIASDNKDAMKVSTPKATIAIRGTGVAGEVQPTGTDTIVLLDGQIGVTSNTDSKTTQNIAQSGYGVTVNPNGLVSPPTLIPTATLNTILNQLGPQGSSAGGTKEQQATIAAISATILSSNNAFTNAVGVANTQAFLNAFNNATNTLTQNNSGTVNVGQLFSLMYQNNDIKNIASTIDNGIAAFAGVDNVTVDVNLLPYFLEAGSKGLGPSPGTFQGKTGLIQFSGNNLPMTDATGNPTIHPCGATCFGTVLSENILVNYDAKTITGNYQLNYTLNGISYSSSQSNTYSVGSDTTPIFNLPIASSHETGAGVSPATNVAMTFSMGTLGSLTNNKFGAIRIVASTPDNSYSVSSIAQMVGVPVK